MVIKYKYRQKPKPKPKATEKAEPDASLVTCSWCTTAVKQEAGVTIAKCRHPFCKECLVTLIRNSASQLVPCPVISSGDTDGDGKHKCCTGHISAEEIKQLLTPEDFQRFSRKPQGKPDAVASKRCRHEVESSTKPAEEAKPPSVNLTPAASICAYCADDLQPQEGMILDMCGCIVCKSCVATIVINSKAACVKCPVQHDDGSACTGHILDREVKYAVSQKRYEEYLSRSLKEALEGMTDTTFKCKTPNCGGWCEIGEGSEKRSFPCPVCSKINCINCEAIHEGVDCAKYQEVLAKAREETGVSRGSKFDKVVEDHMQSGTGSPAGFHQLTAWLNNNNNGKNSVKGLPGPISSEEALKKLESSKLLPTVQPFKCKICMDEIKAGDGAVLQDCLHSFCKDCLRSSIYHCTDPQVQCPHVDPVGGSCKSFLTPREIQALVSSNVVQNHEERSLRRAELIIPNSFHCSNPDCAGWCILEEEDKKEKTFHCPVCWKDTCLTCKVSHPGVSCEYYKGSIRTDNSKIQARNEQKGEEALKKYITEKKLMRCPRCKFICQKISGCSSVNCGACKHHFTWKAKTVKKLE